MRKLRNRDEAIRRGLEFIYRTACDEENFEAYGYDFLGCFHCIDSTSKDANLCKLARQMGKERARHWRRQNVSVPSDVDAMGIVYLILGAVAANYFGIDDRRLTSQIQQAASKFTAQDFFRFDPAAEPPPSDVPEDCRCGAENARGQKTCSSCKRRLKMTSRYDLYTDALIWTYFAERLRFQLGVGYYNVIKWLPKMRPYRGRENGKNPDFYSSIYAVTHVIYTLNGYSMYKLSPRWLPDEYEFLKANLVEAIVMKDPETMGEFLDALKSFGLEDNHPLIRKGTDYLLATQNEDGSWGEMEVEDIYERYHPTWTAIDGLREYAWRGERLHFPKYLKLLERSAGRKAS